MWFNGKGDNKRVACSYVEREVVHCEGNKVRVADSYVERVWLMGKGITSVKQVVM